METITGMADTINLKQLTFKFKINGVHLVLKKRQSRFINKEVVSVFASYLQFLSSCSLIDFSEIMHKYDHFAKDLPLVGKYF